jgi:hypothetical protein
MRAPTPMVGNGAKCKKRLAAHRPKCIQARLRQSSNCDCGLRNHVKDAAPKASVTAVGIRVIDNTKMVIDN